MWGSTTGLDGAPEVMNVIANKDLRLEMIPDPAEAERGSATFHREWVVFAHTINGYKRDPLQRLCGEISTVETARTMTELRCALFHLARQDRWQGGTAPVPDLEENVCQLLRKIRAKLRKSGPRSEP